MINIQTVLKVIDNSGAVFVKCIQIFKKRSGAGIGDIITVVIKKSFVKKNIKKSREIKNGQVCSALVLKTKLGLKRWGGFFLKSSLNCVVLLNKNYLPIGSRIFGVIFREIKLLPQFFKLISIAQVSL
jgi:large subunit ribosomal protein L14